MKGGEKIYTKYGVYFFIGYLTKKVKIIFVKNLGKFGSVNETM